MNGNAIRGVLKQWNCYCLGGSDGVRMWPRHRLSTRSSQRDTVMLVDTKPTGREWLRTAYSLFTRTNN